LDPQQSLILDQIVDYGLDHGYTAKEIAVAAIDAYYESGFKQSAVNGSHIGLFQYNPSTWSANGEVGNINNAFDQIRAIFNDITKYESRYTTAWNDASTGLAASGLSFGQYFEIKHELGNSSTDWNAINPVTGNTYIYDWAAKGATLNIH
jgi:hypothetical protein